MTKSRPPIRAATCAALIHNNRRCEKHAQCSRAVVWFDDLKADFNLCAEDESDPGEFRHFIGMAQPAEAPPKAVRAQPKPIEQASLF